MAMKVAMAQHQRQPQIMAVMVIAKVALAVAAFPCDETGLLLSALPQSGCFVMYKHTATVMSSVRLPDALQSRQNTKTLTPPQKTPRR